LAATVAARELSGAATSSTAGLPAGTSPFGMPSYIALAQSIVRTTLITNGTTTDLLAIMTNQNVASGTGYAISIDGGTVNNYGVILGSVDLGGNGTFNNYGILATGSSIDVGAHGVFTMAAGGLVSPGGGGWIATTLVNGNLRQDAGSDYLVNLDLANNTGSQFAVTGTASLAGTIDLNLMNILSAAPGSHVWDIVSAAGGLTSHDGLTLDAPSSAVATFDLGYDAHDVQLDYTIDYAPRTGGLLNADDVAFGNYLGRIQTAGGSANLTPLVSTVFTLPTVSMLQAFYGRLSPSGTAALSTAALAANDAFSNAMLSCRNGGSLAQLDGNCNWGSFDAVHGSQSASFGGVGYAQSLSGVSAGYQRSIGDGRSQFGAALRYDTGSLDTAGAQSLSGDEVEAGLVAKRIVGEQGVVSASVAAGTGSYSSDRTPSFPTATTSAHGNLRSTFAAAHLRAERNIEHGTTTVRPFVDVGATRVGASALDETGAGVLDAHVAAHGQTFTTLASGVSLETVKHTGSTTLRPALDLSVRRLLGNPQSSTSATLEGAPTTVAPFAVSNLIDRTVMDVAPSLQITSKNKLDLKIGADYGFSSRTHSFGAYVQIGKRL
jgi:hypothetical protein